MPALSSLTAIVTGASAGIGEGIARMLAAEGARVALAARREEELTRVAADIGGETLVVPTDVRDDAALDHLVDRVRAEWGPPDILVNNAGVARIGPLHQMTMKQWDLVMDVNLRAPVYLTRLVLPAMRERGRGYIVNIASEAGAFVLPNMGAYTVSKNGLRIVTELLDKENYDQGIKAWALCPGMVDTDMGADMPGGNSDNFLRVDDIAETVRFLLTQDDNVRMGPEIVIRTMRDPFGG